MAHFAKVLGNKVVAIRKASQEYINQLVDDSPGTWIETFKSSDGTVDTRFNYAGIGYTYDSVRDAFYAPQPYPSWTLNETTCKWEAPVAYPSEGGPYQWNEETTSWDAVE